MYQTWQYGLSPPNAANQIVFGIQTIPEHAWNIWIPSSTYGAMTAGKRILRYFAETEPENPWQQLSLEQVPMKGLHKMKTG